jgi:hypothetical protein
MIFPKEQFPKEILAEITHDLTLGFDNFLTARLSEPLDGAPPFADLLLYVYAWHPWNLVSRRHALHHRRLG